MQQELEEGEDGDDEDRIRRQKFAPQKIRTGAGAGGPPMQPPRNDYVFERGSYAP
jgi:hypothetical protein